MANTALTKTQNQAAIPTIVANLALGALTSFLNLGKTVAKDSELTTQNVGDVINVTKRGTVTANSKTQDSNVTRQAPSLSTIAVTLDQHWEVTIMEEDFTEALQAQTGSGNGTNSVLPGYVEDGVIALAEKIETKLAQLHPSVVHTITGANPVTLANITAVRERMIVNKVPALARKFAYLHPTVITDLLATTPFSDPKFAEKQEGLTEGAVMRLYGFDIFEGQLVQTSGSPVAYHNLLYTRNAFVLATRPMRVPTGMGVEAAQVSSDAGISLRYTRSWNPDALAMQFTLDVLFGVAILDNRLSCELESF